MATVFFVTGIEGGVASLQHRGALLRSNGGVGIVLNISLMSSVAMTAPSDDLRRVILADRSEAVPHENYITVRIIPEKTQSTTSAFLRTEATP